MQSENQSTQLLSGYDVLSDELTNEPVVRSQAHKLGIFHATVQAYVFIQGKLLVQKRSTRVDIGSHKLDQSLATHVLINETPIEALKRGLWNELQIKLEDTIYKPLCTNTQMLISKTYFEHPGLFNRERL